MVLHKKVLEIIVAVSRSRRRDISSKSKSSIVGVVVVAIREKKINVFS